jgi:ABC-type nitrate/sulfonate/bicarbonate transport system substrate-binding protein
MYEFLKKHGIPVNAVKITNMSPPEMVTAFANGAIDGYFAWEPHIYYGEQQLPGKTIVFGPGDLYHGWHSVAMNQDFVKAHPEVVQKLIRGFIKAEEYIHQNPEEAMTIVAKVTGVDKEAIRKLWPEMKPVLRLDKDLIDVMNQEGQWSLSLNPSATTTPKWRDFIYSDALDAVRPSSVNLN